MSKGHNYVGMNYHPQDMAVAPTQPEPKPPQCKAAGIIVLVLGILEFILMIVILIAFAAAAGGTHATIQGYWWEPLLSAAGFIVTGSLALASSLGRPCHIATVVITSLTLAWASIKMLIWGLVLIGLMVATSVVEQNSSSIDLDSRQAVQAGMGIIWAVVLFGFALGLMVFVCLIVILVRVSRLVCCRPQGHDQLGFVVREVPPAVVVVTHPPPVYSNQI